MTPMTEMPLPVVPPEVEAFAAEKGVLEYLPKVLMLARRLFPAQPIKVRVYEDYEIRDLKWVQIVVQIRRDSDFSEITPGHESWGFELFKVCPATHVHAFAITFEPVL